MDKKELSSMELHDEQKNSWLKQFVKIVKDLFINSRKRGDKSLNDFLVEQGESDEEKESIRTQCEEIDNFYESRKRLVAAKDENPEIKDGDWLLQETEKDLNEVVNKFECRDLTSDEKKELSNKIIEQTDLAIEHDAKCLDEELDFMNEIVSEQSRKEDDHE